MIDAFKTLVGKPKWKTSLGRPRQRWEDNIKTGLKGNVSGGFGSGSSASGCGPTAGCREHGNEPSGHIK
jgi:hypothetical protein